MDKALIYLDNNATTAVSPEVLDAMLPFLKELYGNPSSIHNFGGQVAAHVAEAREKVAALLGADADEVILTSCGTESDNAAIHSALVTQPDKRHIITSRVEHPAVLNLCTRLAEHEHYRLTQLSVDSRGMLDLDELTSAVNDDTAIVSVMYANNETGVIFPIEEIGQIVKSKGALFHVDAVQAVGKIPLDMSKSTVDMLSLSGHKFHAPKGVGALYVRRGTRFSPWFIGGHQERSRRGGTEAVPNIVALGKAAELAMEAMDEENGRVKRLRDKLESEVLGHAIGASVNGGGADRTPNTSNVSFEYVEGEAILLMLDRERICASSGSACTTGSLEPSHVLRSMGVPYTRAHGSVRLSLSRYNTEEEVDRVVEVLPGIINRLREISPFGRGQRAKSN
ncbi:MAG: cysteine desulfurase NifS [Phycisphaerae bacterium]|nr:cysteine desulfurase NifS [Phycisphaerae bacterium]